MPYFLYDIYYGILHSETQQIAYRNSTYIYSKHIDIIYYFAMVVYWKIYYKCLFLSLLNNVLEQNT